MSNKSGTIPEIQASYTNPFTGVTTSGNMASAIPHTIPTGYHERVAQIWKNYDTDDGFSYLIDRISHYGVNGTSWRCKDKGQEDFWNEWARRINSGFGKMGVDNIIPGLDEVQKWNMKHLALGGMAVNQWQWGSMEINGKTYQVPILWTLHNELSAKLRRKGIVFGKEDVYMKITKKQSTSIQNLNREYARAYELDDIKNDFIKLKNAFALKYNYSSADNTREDLPASFDDVKSSLYPTPPFLTCNEFIAVRKQLRAMDLQITDGFINKILLWKIGTVDHPPVPAKKDKDGTITEESTITQVRKQIVADNTGTIKQLFVPYYVDLEIKTPDIQPLLAKDKYVEATVQLLWKFGILVAPSGDSRLNLTNINVANFEQLIDFIRLQHYRRFIEGIVCRQIVEKNKDKLTEIPSLTFNPLNTKTDEFRQGILDLMKIGKVDTKTGLKVFGINRDIVIANLKEELDENRFDKENKGKYMGTSMKEMFDTNVPVSFRQQAESLEQEDLGKGKTKTFDRLGTREGGHPAGEKNKKED